MDYIESLTKQASQLTMYDLKSYYNQAKNAVLNVSEMEAKVREATNDDAWGASSTLMQQIADGTHNFQNFNEIMPTIYARFMEKEAREWRQIYKVQDKADNKALTLLEFLVKNGSERVVDDARAHVSTIKMLRSFHYIDEKGKDQGINVRNRAQEIASLLSDVERIRAERRKARANKNKYQGQGNDGGGGLSFATASGGRYGGFGSESLSGGGGGGGAGGFDDYPGRSARSAREDRIYASDRQAQRDRDGDYSTRPRDITRQVDEYDEYEGADDFDSASGPPRRKSPATGTGRPQPPPKADAAPVKKEKEKAKEVNLFDFDDEPLTSGSGAVPSASTNILGGDDDFDDFQTAPSQSATTSSAPAPAPAAAASRQANNSNLFDLLNSTTTSSQPPSYSTTSTVPSLQTYNGGMTSPPLTAAAASKPNYNFTSPVSAPAAQTSMAGTQQQKPKPAAMSTFDDLWTSSLSTVSTSTPGQAQGKKSLNEMGQEKTVEKLWGSGVGSASQGGAGSGSESGGMVGNKKNDFDDLLL